MSGAPEHDVYAGLLDSTRPLRAPQRELRAAWFDALAWDRKEDALFELEALLKGLACAGLLRNLPGGAASRVVVAQDHQAQVRLVRDGVARAAQLVRGLAGEPDAIPERARGDGSPEDAARARLASDVGASDAPEAALATLRSALGQSFDLADGLLRAGRVSQRVWTAFHGTLVREITRSGFFDPLVALDFCPEYDRIRAPSVLALLAQTQDEATHRVLALTFLSLFRATRYLALVDAYAADPPSARRALLPLAALRSDVRALTRYLTTDAAGFLADGLERTVLATPASAIARERDALTRHARDLAALRCTLESGASALVVEVRRVFAFVLPTVDASLDDRALADALRSASAALRAALHHTIASLTVELVPGAAPPALDDERGARREAGARLRRDAWIFQQVTRAFLELAAARPDASDLWVGPSSLAFVRDFLGHFRAIGHPLARASGYPRLAPLLAALEALRDVDLLDPARLAAAVDECTRLAAFLGELVQEVAARPELASRPFDRREAADAMRVYLGRA